MSAESRRWLVYAQENLRVAALGLEGNLFNPCLQNTQQRTPLVPSCQISSPMLRWLAAASQSPTTWSLL